MQVSALIRNLNRFVLPAVAVVFVARSAVGLEVIDPSGVSYTGISANSEYNSDYAASKLFDTDMTGFPVDTTITTGGEWARVGGSPGFVAFEVGQVYDVGSIYYAQRAGANATSDKITQISVWASSSTPFTAADPGTAPASVVAVTQNAGAVWTEYLLTNVVTGRYFLIKAEQNPIVAQPNNIGGRELRLGRFVFSVPPGISQQPASRTLFQGGVLRLNVQATGSVPLNYQWKKGSTPLQNGGGISGATSPKLVIAGVAPGDAGNYSCTITNSAGTTNTDTAIVTVLTLPTGDVASAIVSNSPVGFWRLNEAGSSSTAVDNFGSFDGTYGASSLSADGPRPPLFPGFSSTNVAVETTGFTIPSAVALPALNLSTNTVTIIAWIYPEGGQQPYTGIVFNRSPGTAAGLIFSGDGTQLAYQWNGQRYDFDSQLLIPSDEWVMVGMVVTPTGTTLYAGVTNVLRSRQDAFGPGIQAFAGTTYIGLDTDVGGSARTFNGRIDDVAIFNRALTPEEMLAIYAVGTGTIIPAPLEITTQPSDQVLFAGELLQLSPVLTGTGPIQYQWYKSINSIPAATNRIYSVAQVTTNDAGDYYLIASNQVGSVTSVVAHVTVSTEVVNVLSPNGALYTGISASSEFPGGGYGPGNLFTTDVTGVPLGTQLTGGDWADDGVSAGLGPAYLAFQVDQSYTVRAIYYAQRSGAFGGATDKITGMSIWASQIAAFDPLNPTADPADAIVAVPDLDAAVWHRYVLPSTSTGKYFLIKVEQNPTVQFSNIGGNELRLGVLQTAQPLRWSATASSLTLYWSSGTLLQADSVAGPWQPAVGVTSGVPIPASQPKKFFRLQY